MYYVYILYSSTLNLYYIGAAEDPNERLKKHLGKHKGFTSKAKDWTIKYVESFELKSEALKREKTLKRWKNRSRIEELINKANL